MMVSAISNMDPSINRLIAAASGTATRTRQTDRIESTAAPHEAAPTTAAGKSELTEEEKRQVEELEQRDQEVRRHEQAHKAAAGRHARGGPTFEYETGPNGTRYAIGGEVSIDTSPVKGDPQATLAKAQQIRRAATAPAEPSSQDRAVAAKAAALEQDARRDLAQQDVEGAAESATAPTAGPPVHGGKSGVEPASGTAITAAASTENAQIANNFATSEAAAFNYSPRDLVGRSSPSHEPANRSPRSIYENASTQNTPVGRFIDVAV